MRTDIGAGSPCRVCLRPTEGGPLAPAGCGADRLARANGGFALLFSRYSFAARSDHRAMRELLGLPTSAGRLLLQRIPWE
jgi:hypothetical protein